MEAVFWTVASSNYVQGLAGPGNTAATHLLGLVDPNLRGQKGRLRYPTHKALGISLKGIPQHQRPSVAALLS